MDDRQNRLLGTLLLGPDRTPPSDMIERVREAARTRENREYIEAEMPHVEWPGVWKAIEHRLPDVFDIDLQDVVAGAFKKYKALKKYCDPEKYPASKPVSVPLGERTLSSTHKPKLDIVIDGTRIGSIEFSIKLQLQLKAAMIELRGGVIHGLDTGNAVLKGSAWLGKVPLLEKEIAEFDLPGHLDLDRGLPLPWSRPGASNESGAGSPPAEPATRSEDAETRVQTDRDRALETTTVRRYYVLPSLALLAGFALLAFVMMEKQGRLIEPAPPVVQPTYALNIVTEPPGADIRLPGLDTPYRPGMKLPPGRYELEVTHPDYETQRTKVRLLDRDLEQRIRLVKARIPTPVPEPYRDTQRETQGKAQRELRRETDRRVVQPEPGRRERVRTPPPPEPHPEPPPEPPPDPLVPEPPAGTYAVHLSSDPPGAYIKITGIGEYTPGMRLKPGRYEVLLRKNGYQRTYTWIQVKNRPLEKRFKLLESDW